MKKLTFALLALSGFVVLNTQADFKSFLKGAKKQAKKAFETGKKVAQSEEFKTVTRTGLAIATSPQARAAANFALDQVKGTEQYKKFKAEMDKRGITAQSQLWYEEAQKRGLIEKGQQLAGKGQQFLAERGYVAERPVKGLPVLRNI